MSIKDFTLRYEDSPILGKIIIGKPLVASTVVQNDFNDILTTASYIIQVIDKNRTTIAVQTKNVDISSPAPIELLATWIPENPGSYTITGFIWSQSKDQTNVPLATKTSVNVNIGPKLEIKIHTLCLIGCEYSDLQKAIDHLHKPENKIVVSDGNYELFRPINVWSNTNLEFSVGAKIAYWGDENTTVFRGNRAANIEILNPQITLATSNPGINAFSFTSSNRISISGGELTLNEGGDSAGFYCRDCTNVEISGLNMSHASRLIDIGTSSNTNNGKSSNIWIRNGIFDGASIEGIKVNYSDRVYIIGNSVSNTNDNAIDIGHSSHSIVSNNEIENGGIPSGSGIHTDSAISAEIFGNILNGTGEAGITVFRATDINIINNTIANARSVGIQIITAQEPSSNVQVKHNKIKNSIGPWIYVSLSQKNVELSNNQFD